MVDPDKEMLIGAEYTTEADILTVVDPVVMQPLQAEWYRVDAEVTVMLMPSGQRDDARIRRVLRDFQSRLSSVRVLDPACGSGNFLYVALRQLHNLERSVLARAADLGLRGFRPEVSPEQCYGIEINEYASDLARTALWIGHLQWLIENGHHYDREPVLGSLNTIERRDAIIDLTEPERPAEPEWPAADYIVGNPPFLGHATFRERLSDQYADAVYALYGDRIPNSSDLCCYWFEKARAMIEAGDTQRAGLLATQSIRFQSNRPVLERIKKTGDIFRVVSDQEWKPNDLPANSGSGNVGHANSESRGRLPANVHISIICFDDGSQTARVLDGESVNNINADLTGGADLTQAKTLVENRNLSFQGVGKVGDFDIPEAVALEMMAKPNPHGRPNAEVIKPWINGTDITQRSRNVWIIDFGVAMSEADAALYEAPFEYVKEKVMPERINNRMPWRAENWWLHGYPATTMRQALAPLQRYIGTPKVAKHRFFVWLAAEMLPSNLVIAIASDDDYMFGLLSSAIHELWARHVGSQLREAESGGTYTPTTCFETFPFPEPTGEQRESIANAAAELNQLRENWRNPTDMFGNPALNADQLRRRTLTNLYNEYPTWLANAHDKLDAAVTDAYGWPPDLREGEILERLLDLNLARANAEPAPAQQPA